MKNTIWLNILFLVGVIIFIGKDAYAGYTSGFGLPVYPDKYFNAVVSVVAVLGVILTVATFKAFKEGEKVRRKRTESDESVQNFKKHNK